MTKNKEPKYQCDFFIEDAGITVRGNSITEMKQELAKVLKHPEYAEILCCVSLPDEHYVDLKTVPWR